MWCLTNWVLRKKLFRGCILLAAGFICLSAGTIVHADAVSLYHQAWQDVESHTYDPDKLVDWKKFEHKFDSQIKTVDDAVKFFNEAVSVVHDDYTRLLDPQQTKWHKDEKQGSFVGVGIVFPTSGAFPELDANGEALIKKVEDNLPAAKAGIVADDTLLKIDGKDIKGWRLENIIYNIRGVENTTVKLTIRHEGVESEKTVMRVRVNIPATEWKMLPDDIGYIHHLTYAQNDSADEFASALKSLAKAKILIVDLRDNGGGIISEAHAVCSMLIDKGKIGSARKRIPGSRSWNTVVYELTNSHLLETARNGNTIVSTTYSQRRDYLANHRPMVLLVNEGTASAAEITTGALMDNKVCVVMGTKTYGKGIGQSYIDEELATRMQVTSMQLHSPNGFWAGNAGDNRIGYKPEIEVLPVQGIKFGTDNDNQLNEAIVKGKAMLAAMPKPKPVVAKPAPAKVQPKSQSQPSNQPGRFFRRRGW